MYKMHRVTQARCHRERNRAIIEVSRRRLGDTEREVQNSDKPYQQGAGPKMKRAWAFSSTPAILPCRNS